MGLLIIIEEGVEVDDVIGILVCQVFEQGIDILISIGDKDMVQLVNEYVILINIMMNQFMDVEGVKDKFGILLELIIDFFVLKGDKVDNILGVLGVGDKSVQGLLNGIGGIDVIYENFDKIVEFFFCGVKMLGKKMVEYEEQVCLLY